jgi:hypothetical protein
MKRTTLFRLVFLTTAAAVLSARVAFAGDQTQFQLGYVFDSWTSNFVYSGTEHRIPASFQLHSGDFGLSAEGAFVAGDYERSASGGFQSASYKSSQFSDSTLSASLDMKMGPTLLSTFTGTLNVGTGDTTWESQSSAGAIPFLFEPSFYHGRGWGGSLFWSLASTQETFQWGAGAGYLLTTTYDTSLTDQSLFNPGDSLILMGSMGGNLSATGKIGIQAYHTFAFQSKVTDPLAQFTSAESTVFTGQWLERMGNDKFAFNASYSFYGRGMVSDQNTGQQVRETENYLGDRLELRPFLGYGSVHGVSMMTGLVWDHLFPNGYGPTDGNFYQPGGDLLGVEQSVTFAMGSGAFLNLAGLYHYVYESNAAQDQVTRAFYNVSFNRISFGTNVGFQW